VPWHKKRRFITFGYPKKASGSLFVKLGENLGMARKCFISFKYEDKVFKEYIQNDLKIDMIDKSLDDPIDSDDEDYIMRRIREEYLANSTVTIHLIGANSAENAGYEEQKFIKRELQASLFNGENNTKNGILGIVLPSMYDRIYTGSGTCQTCGNTHTYVNIRDSNTVKEFTYNYYIPNTKCSWSEEDRYCVLVKWSDFIEKPETHIEAAFEKRNHLISEKTKVRPE
jgi:hypothetical protein